MCGILGVVSKKSQLDKESLIYLRDQMIHRGPDACGIWMSEDKNLAFAHRRLSIIDLHETSNQPMQDSSGEFIIIFNGEIYNFMSLREELISFGHHFETSSDTEVILASYKYWGHECLQKLNGMFSFCIYDKNKGELFMARDRAGEKPFYYSLEKDFFIFSSELKSILARETNSKVDNNSLDCFLSFGYVPAELCILDRVKKLPPAHAMTIKLDNLEKKQWRYWSIPQSNVSPKNIVETELLDELEELIEDSVKKQLISDVPVGVLLSGGVDSSLVTAMASRAEKKIRTFTISFPGFNKYDESDHARLIADSFNTEHLELSADNPEPDILYVLAKQFDEPIIDSSMIPTFLVSQLIRKHCTVALGGDGGDELFGGYSNHSRLLWTYSKAKYIPFQVRSLLAYLASNLPYGFKGREWLRGLDCDFKKSLPLVSSHLDKKIRKRIFNRKLQLGHFAEDYRLSRIPETNDLLERVTRMDFENYLPEDILVKVDRASMLNSLEIRAPLLDYRIIEFAYSKLNSHMKTNSQERKIFLKKLCQRVLPEEFDYQRKQGFSIPLQDWLKKGPWRDFFKDTLFSSKVFNHKSIQELFHAQDKGYQNSERLFGLVMLELWMREYNIDFD